MEENQLEIVRRKKNYWMRRTVALGIVIGFAAMAMASLVPEVSAATDTVRVKITRITEIDDIDGDTQCDFYWYVWVGSSHTKTNVPYKTNDDDLYGTTDFGSTGYWYYDFSVTYDTAKPTTLVVIELWEDDTNADDFCDISRRVNQDIESSGMALVLSYNIVAETWTGDDGYYLDGAVGTSQGDESPDGSTGVDQDDARIIFSIETTTR